VIHWNQRWAHILEALPETLAQLPEAVRQKIGFKAHKQAATVPLTGCRGLFAGAFFV
jgi:hypothetical protein